MCRTTAEGGRRCPGCSSPQARAAHNERRVNNRAQRTQIVTAAAEAGVDDRIVQVLHTSSPSVAKRWSEQPTAGAAEPSSPFTRRYDTVEDKIAAFQSELEQRIADLGHDEQWQRYLDTMASFPRYSMNNVLLIGAQRPDATLVAGFKKWQQMGRHVRKGERGIAILAPRTIRTSVEDGNGRPVLGDDGRPLKSVRVVGFTTATVFDVSQTDGKDLPTPYPQLTETPPPGLTEDLEAAIRADGYHVEYTEDLLADGSTSAETRTVKIKRTLTPAMQTATLAHELGHIRAGHLDRLQEYHTAHDGGHRGDMEIEAESIAYAVCRANGMTTKLGDSSSAYVAGWAKTAGPDAVKSSAARVAAVVKDLLTSRSWTNHREPST